MRAGHWVCRRSLATSQAAHLLVVPTLLFEVGHRPRQPRHHLHQVRCSSRTSSAAGGNGRAASCPRSAAALPHWNTVMPPDGSHTQGCLSFAARMFEAACLTLRIPELHPRRVEDALHLPHAGWENIAQSAQTRRVSYGQYVPSPSSPLRCGGCVSPEPPQHRLAKASATGEAMNVVNRRVPRNVSSPLQTKTFLMRRAFTALADGMLTALGQTCHADGLLHSDHDAPHA